MKKQFKWSSVVTYLEQLDIQDIGNTIIRGCNRDHSYNYLRITSEWGMCKILEVKGLYPDDLYKYDVKSLKISYRKIKYSENKLSDTIQAFLDAGDYEDIQVLSPEAFERECYVDLCEFFTS